jgi:hypothetical protein
MIPEEKSQKIINNLNRIIDMKKDLNGFDSWTERFGIMIPDDGTGHSKVDSAIETIISFLSIEYVKISNEFKEKFKEDELKDEESKEEGMTIEKMFECQ